MEVDDSGDVTDAPIAERKRSSAQPIGNSFIIKLFSGTILFVRYPKGSVAGLGWDWPDLDPTLK